MSETTRQHGDQNTVVNDYSQLKMAAEGDAESRRGDLNKKLAAAPEAKAAPAAGTLAAMTAGAGSKVMTDKLGLPVTGYLNKVAVAGAAKNPRKSNNQNPFLAQAAKNGQVVRKSVFDFGDKPAKPKSPEYISKHKMTSLLALLAPDISRDLNGTLAAENSKTTFEKVMGAQMGKGEAISAVATEKPDAVLGVIQHWAQPQQDAVVKSVLPETDVEKMKEQKYGEPLYGVALKEEQRRQQETLSEAQKPAPAPASFTPPPPRAEQPRLG